MDHRVRRSKKTRRIGEEAAKVFELERGTATDAEVQIVQERLGGAVLNIRQAVVLDGLSEGRHTVEAIVDWSGLEPRVVADAARELVAEGLAREDAPGIWRLTKPGWEQAHRSDR